MIWTETLRANCHGSDLQFLVELRGFEPLTPSMRTKRSAVQMDGEPYRLVLEGDSRVCVVREAPDDPGVLPSTESRGMAGRPWWHSVTGCLCRALARAISDDI